MKALLIAFTPLLLFLAVVPKMITIYERRQILKEPAITVGKIVQMEPVKNRYNRFYRAHVQYWVDGKPFKTKSRAFHSLTDRQLYSLQFDKLPVIYEKKNPSNGIVLSTEKQFGHFELPFPDSLTWTRSYFY